MIYKESMALGTQSAAFRQFSLVHIVIMLSPYSFGPGLLRRGVAFEAGRPLIVVLSFIPAIGQLVLLWLAWTTTGAFFTLHTILFLAWLALGILIGNVAIIVRR